MMLASPPVAFLTANVTGDEPLAAAVRVEGVVRRSGVDVPDEGDLGAFAWMWTSAPYGWVGIHEALLGASVSGMLRPLMKK